MIRHNSNRGFTLIELMIALVLGLLVVGAVIQLFVSNKQTYRITEAHSLLQDNGRFALEELTRTIRSAGYVSCRPVKVTNIAKNSTITLEEGNVIIGNEATSSGWTPALPSTIVNPLSGTDAITIQHSESCGGTLVGNIEASNANIHIAYPNSCGVNKDDIIMISDCENGHIFQVTTVSSDSTSENKGKQTISYGSNVNQANHLCKSYASLPSSGSCAKGEEKTYTYDSEVTLIKSRTYFIRKNTDSEVPSLYRYDQLNNTTYELIEGVEDMQILYGLDDNNDAIIDRTENAEKIQTDGHWARVISAEINLLLTTIEKNLAPSNQTISFNNKTITGTDGRIRRIFSTTIAIRNRMQ